jgi:hypothetical protein
MWGPAYLDSAKLAVAASPPTLSMCPEFAVDVFSDHGKQTVMTLSRDKRRRGVKNGSYAFGPELFPRG